MANDNKELEQKLIDDALSGIIDWENDMSEFFGNWNDWANSYRMKTIIKEKRPDGVSKNISGETPRAVNALASSITRMQTLQDPYFELRSEEATEEELYQLEKKYNRMLLEGEFKRKLLKGNKGMCLFGTQVWEEPYVQSTNGIGFTGTDFNPLSLLQVAFRSGVYDINHSDFIGGIHHFNSNYLRFITSSDVWNKEAIEAGIKEKESNAESGYAKSSIETRRNVGGYQTTRNNTHEVILFHGRLSDYDNPLIAQMWEYYGRTDDPRNSDITIGILNRRHLIRLNPTPYGTWHHMYKIAHYSEFELEPIAYGVGAMAHVLQKDINRILRRVNDVELFSLYNMNFVGLGAGLKSNKLDVFPWNLIPVQDVNQIKEIRPQIEGIINGIKLLEHTREDFRAVTNATSTLQAVLTGATATESSLAQSEAMRAVSLVAEINADAVIRKHLDTLHKNEIDQNPYDQLYIPNVQFTAKVTTDKDFRPEHTKKLLEFLQLSTSIRQTMPMDFNPMPIIKYFARSIGINPADLREPRPQVDRMLDAMKRINGNSELKEQVGAEAASVGANGGITEPAPQIPAPIGG